MESIPDKNPLILIVDDNESLLSSMKNVLMSAGMPEPALLSDSRSAMALVKKFRFQLVLLDLIMPHKTGIEILQEIKRDFPEIECIIVTAIDDVNSAVRAMQFGAYDYLTKPFESERLIITMNRALERYSLRHGVTPFGEKGTFSDIKNPAAFHHMIAEDDKMALIFHQAEIVAPTDYNLFITGETGTGKELLARIIHNLSYRAGGRFVGVNVSASSKTLFEDDFFGRTKGAYTGAVKGKKGFFEMAQRGSLFLDEITELEIDLQGKLLRVIQERELLRLGGTQVRNIDVRIISATNRNIKEVIQKGFLRDDLFYRLNTFHINIPPLRERRKDVLPLARHFLKIHAANNQKKIDSIAADLSDNLLDYHFPGNVRELESIIAGAVLCENSGTLTMSSVQKSTPIKTKNRPQEHHSQGKEFLPLGEMEKRHIVRALEATEGNRTRAANMLGIGLRTLQRKLKAYEKQPD